MTSTTAFADHIIEKHIFSLLDYFHFPQCNHCFKRQVPSGGCSPPIPQKCQVLWIGNVPLGPIIPMILINILEKMIAIISLFNSIEMTSIFLGRRGITEWHFGFENKFHVLICHIMVSKPKMSHSEWYPWKLSCNYILENLIPIGNWLQQPPWTLWQNAVAQMGHTPH